LERVKKGIHFLFGRCEPVTDFYGVINRFGSLGFDCVELPPDPFLMDSGRLRDLKEYAEGKGVEIVFSCGFPENCDMASDDRFIRENGMKYMHRILRLMENADIRLMGGTFYTKWPSYRVETLSMGEKERIFQRTALCLKEAVKETEGSLITLAIEPLNRFEGFLINTAAEGRRFCEIVDNPNVGLMLDGFHMSVEEDSIQDAVRIAGKHLKHLHLAENNRKLPGMGTFCWDEFFTVLKEIGYTGRFDIEAFMTPGGSVAASVALWRDLEEGASPKQQDDLLVKAAEFIETKWLEYGFLS
jgi:D-psicose/D-tagatose/L-ribulose 3-epimerase